GQDISPKSSATHPLEGSRQEARRPPCTTLANFFAVALCAAYSTPRRVAADASLCCVVHCIIGGIGKNPQHARPACFVASSAILPTLPHSGSRLAVQSQPK